MTVGECAVMRKLNGLSIAQFDDLLTCESEFFYDFAMCLELLYATV